MFLFMDSEQMIVMPPTYWLESDVSVSVLIRNVAMIETGYVRFLMNERSFEEFRDKKGYRYRKLMHIVRFRHGYDKKGRSPLQGVPARVIAKTFSAGKDTFESFRLNGSRVLRSVFSSQSEIDYFLEKLAGTQKDVFIWESMIEELLSDDLDVGKAESAGLRTIMDSTYYHTYLAAGFTIPSGSELDHRLMIARPEAGWCRLDKLRLVCRLLGLEPWLHNAQSDLICDMKNLIEWRNFAALTRTSVSSGENVEKIVANQVDTAQFKKILKEVGRMGKSKPAGMHSKEETIVGNFVFFSINGLKFQETRVAAGWLKMLADVSKGVANEFPGYRVFPTLTGCIGVLKDGASANFVDLVFATLSRCQALGVELRAGIHRGVVPLLTDLDGSITPISPGINKCARIAHADRSKLSAEGHANSAVLASIEFADHAASGGMVSRTDDEWLFPDARKTWITQVDGKRNEKFDVVVAPQSRYTHSEGQEQSSEDISITNLDGCLLLAYDLPSFSEGDQTRLSSRFYDVARIVSKNLEQLGRPIDLLHSPGGDGGVLIISNLGQEAAFSLALNVNQDLDILNNLRTEDAATSVRVGMHYSGVSTFIDAHGVNRGTGAGVFIADELANDKVGRDTTEVVYSGSFKDAASRGDDAHFDRHFEWIEELETSSGFKITRFIRKG